MTSAHLLYIPIVFSLGLLVGTLLSSNAERSTKSHQKPDGLFPKGSTLFGSFLIFMAAFVGTHFFEIPRSSKAVSTALNDLEIFDKAPSFSSEEVYSRIASFPLYGMAIYKEFTYTIDVFFPITLLAFLILLSLYVTKRGPISRQFRITLLLIPMIWFVMDMIENYSIYHLLDTFPAKNETLAGMLGYITITKFTLLLLAILIPTILRTFGKSLLRKIGASSQPQNETNRT
ncbi:hypothetical protein [Reichenbachiella ulvae]|uniref:Uncharacterized protein n=1 Tax=Reichenbachiella ulvae TaxID=2980104 RepID=A0ABT3CQX7_9BACT|nr:hypothetical protein [Reichenbachiella ulvae]MCV9386017.1 hypothetical protein [Reichenbachiella ulvae]